MLWLEKEKEKKKEKMKRKKEAAIQSDNELLKKNLQIGLVKKIL